MKGMVIVESIKKAFPKFGNMDVLAGVLAATTLMANPKGSQVEQFAAGMSGMIDVFCGVVNFPKELLSMKLKDQDYFSSVLPLGEAALTLCMGLETMDFEERQSGCEEKILEARSQEVERVQKISDEFFRLFLDGKNLKNKEILEQLRKIPESKIIQ